MTMREAVVSSRDKWSRLLKTRNVDKGREIEDELCELCPRGCHECPILVYMGGCDEIGYFAASHALWHGSVSPWPVVNPCARKVIKACDMWLDDHTEEATE